MNKSEFIASLKKEMQETRTKIKDLEDKRNKMGLAFSPLDKMQLNNFKEVLKELDIKLKSVL